LRKTILRIANLPRRLLENQKSKRQARKEKEEQLQVKYLERIKNYAVFTKEVERVMRDQGLSRMAAIGVVTEAEMEVRRIKAGGPPVDEKVIRAEATFEGARKARKPKENRKGKRRVSGDNAEAFVK